MKDPNTVENIKGNKKLRTLENHNVTKSLLVTKSDLDFYKSDNRKNEWTYFSFQYKINPKLLG